MDKPFVNMAEKAKYHFSHFPIWSCGNAFFAGAKPWKHEKDALVDTEHEIQIALVDGPDGPHLETNLYEFLNGFTDRMINSDILGNAFEPDQRFENPDGTSITFDRDYFGTPRGLRPIPGPFASAIELEKHLC